MNLAKLVGFCIIFLWVFLLVCFYEEGKTEA